MKYRRQFLGEALGTFMLVLFGCGSVAVSILFDAHEGLMQVALAWGIGVTLSIYLTRHLSCAHLNPARDLGPRLVAALMGWGRAAFPDHVGGFFIVYVLAPLLSGVAASLLFVRVLEPAMNHQPHRCDCNENQSD